MTILVGIAEAGKVYLAADRGMSEVGFLGVIVNHKVKKVGQLVIGYSANQGTGQLAHYTSYNYNNLFYEDLEAWLRLDFCEELQRTADRFKIDISNPDNASDFLVGAQGRMFEITTQDWSVSEYREIATGSGYRYAMGSLYTSKGMAPRERVKLAAHAAIAYSPECAKPVDIVVL